MSIARIPKPVLSVFVGLLALTGQGEPVSLDSPFLPAPTAGQIAPEGGSLELRGIVASEAGRLFNIVETSSKKGAWVGLNEKGRSYVVTGYEMVGDTETVAVDYQGRSLRLALPKPKTAKAAFVPAGPTAALPAQQTTAQGPISPVVLNPTPADEARRLEDFRSELLRRRMQRQQGAQPAAAPTPPPAPVQTR